MRRLIMFVLGASLMTVGRPPRAQSQDSSARAVADTNPYAHLPHLEFTAQIEPGNPAPNIPRSLLDSLAMPARATVMAIVESSGSSFAVRRSADARIRRRYADRRSNAGGRGGLSDYWSGSDAGRATTTTALDARHGCAPHRPVSAASSTRVWHGAQRSTQ